MVQVIKKGQETNISLLKRFSRQIKQSGRLLRFKKSQFQKRPASEFKEKQRRLKSERQKQKMIKLYKLGKIERPPANSLK